MTESQYDEVVQALTNMNVKLIDVNGNYRDTYDIFKDIAAQWDEMSSTDQAALATKLSGTRMQAVFYSLVQNFGEAEKAMEAMGAAEGELTKKNEVYVNSVEGRMTQFKNEFKKLASDIFSSEWIKEAVGMAKDLLGILARLARAITDIVKTLGGLKSTLAIIGTIWGGLKIYKTITSLETLANAISKAKASGVALTGVQRLMLKGNADLATSSVTTGGALKALGAGLKSAFLSAPGIIAAVTAAIIGLNVAVSRYQEQEIAKRVSETSEAFEDAKTEASEASDALNEATKKLKDNRDAYVELVELNPIEYTSEDSLGKLREATEELRQQKEYAEEIERQATAKTGRAFAEKMDALNETPGEYGLFDFGNRASNGSPIAKLLRGEFANFASLLRYYNNEYIENHEKYGDYKSFSDTLEQMVYELTSARFNGYQDVSYQNDAAISEFIDYLTGLISGVERFENPQTYQEKHANWWLDQISLYIAQLQDASNRDAGASHTITEIAKQFGYESVDAIREASERSGTTGDLYGQNFVDFWAAIRQETGLKTTDVEEMLSAVEDAFKRVDREASAATVQTDEFGNVIDSASADAAALATTAYENAEALGKLGVALKDASAASEGLNRLDKIFTDIANGETFDYASIVDDKFVEEFGSLGSVFTNFINTVSNAPNDLEACRKAFDDLATAYILQDKYLGNVDEETKQVVATLLEEQGVSNATALINEYLAGTYSGIILQKAEINRTEINTSKDVDNLINLATQAKMTAESLEKLEQVKSLMSLAGRLLADKGPEDRVYKKLVTRANAILDDWFDVDYAKAIADIPTAEDLYGGYAGGDAYRQFLESLNKETGGSSGATESTSEKIKTWFEEQYAEHKHLVAMEKETDYEYYTWLEGAMKKAYAEGILSQEDYWKYEEEVYNGMKKLRENAEKEAQSNLDKLVDIRKKMLEKEVSDQKDALNDQLKNLKDFYDKQKKMLQDSYDEEDYLEEQAEKRKSVSDLEEELARLRYDDSAWAQKRRAEISQQIADARKDLNDFERDHARDEALSFLDEQESAAEEKINAQIETLDEKYKSAKELYEQALADVKNGSVELYREMIKWNGEYGDGIDETITSAWEGAYQALSDYNTLFGKTFKGVNLANVTGYVLKPVGTGYASGTSYAVPGLHPIDEKGSETYFSPSTGGKYKMFSGGEKVLTAKASDFLYRFANGGSEMLKKFIASVGGGVLNDRLTPLMTNNEIVMGDVIVNGNADRSTVSEIRRAQRESVEFMLKEFGKLNR